MSPGLLGTDSGTRAPTVLPERRLFQRARRSFAVRSQICFASSQPTTGATIAPRTYQARGPVKGSRIMAITATTPTATRRAVARAEARLSSRLETAVRIWKTSSHSRRPGRKSRPQTAITTVRRVSRSLRRRLAARQCSTTACGSMPKDWTTGLRPTPSIRFTTDWAKASPRLGRKIVAHLRLGLTFDSCHSLLASRIFPTSSSRYAAEARA